MNYANTDRWPDYTYVVPHSYTKARVRLTGLGTYVPGSLITNDFFAYISTRLGSPRKAEDLERVTGLETRHVRASTLEYCRKIVGPEAPGLIEDATARPDESMVDMAVAAAERALASAGLTANQIDTIVAASSSDNEGFPTIAGLVQLRLGCGPIRTLTIKGACACQSEGFQACAEILAAGSARRVLLIAAEALLPNIMHILDWKTSSLFGEGAAAFVLEASDDDADLSYVINGTDAHQGPALSYRSPFRKDAIDMAEIDMKILQLYHEGRGAEVNQLLAQPMIGYTKMNGKEVYREAPRAMAECVEVLRRHAGLSPDDITHIVPHQANSRITRRLGDLLVNDHGWPQSTMEKLADHFRYYGNLSNASIGMALIEMLRQNRLQSGQWMALTAVGGGLQYGCWLVRYYDLPHVEAAI